MDKVRVGVVGCGAISPAYLRNMTGPFADLLEVRACADLVKERAAERAREFGVPRVSTVDEILRDADIEMVLNLTVPGAHFEVTMAALEAGKHVFSEKPLAVTREEGRRIVRKAAEKRLLVAGAADTFLGAGLQTCRKLIDEGAIGTVISAQAMIAMRYRSEKQHKRGLGPVFDMGPYFLTSLAALLGPAERVTGSAQTPFAEEPFPPDSPDHGKTFAVETPMNVSAVLDLARGGIGVLTAVGEVPGYNPRLEFYGTEGVLVANDPNMYSGRVVLRPQGGEGRDVPLVPGFSQQGRALGVAEMAYAIRSGRKPRAGVELMFHVLDIMQAVHEASDQGRHVKLSSTCERPEPFDPAELHAQ